MCYFIILVFFEFRLECLFLLAASTKIISTKLQVEHPISFSSFCYPFWHAKNELQKKYKSDCREKCLFPIKSSAQNLTQILLKRHLNETNTATKERRNKNKNKLRNKVATKLKREKQKNNHRQV